MMNHTGRSRGSTSSTLRDARKVQTTLPPLSELPCMCCGRLITSATITLPCAGEIYKSFGGAWILDCGHALDAYCVADILKPQSFQIIDIEVAAEEMGRPPDESSCCIEKVYSCRFPECAGSFSIIPRHPELPFHDTFLSYSHADGPWTFASNTNGLCTLTPYRNWGMNHHVHGTLDDLYNAGYDVIEQLKCFDSQRSSPKYYVPVRYILK
ncbi:hypothetical protein BDZ89DRAFT_1168196 [Hymenopellis radicata]|nr:hypothetical protein BDZ89DRAFT_1168196 [Hymenopellis radicata]